MTSAEAVDAPVSESARRPPFRIQVETAGGEPLPNVLVVRVDASTNAVLSGTNIEGGSERLQTDANGQFTLSHPELNPVFLLATDAGFGIGLSRDLANQPTLVVHPWGRIDGIRINRNQPAPGQRIMVDFDSRCLGDEDPDRPHGRIGLNKDTVTDAQGRFVFEQVPPAGLRLLEVERSRELWNVLLFTEVKPGERKILQIATQGRTVVGQLEPDEGFPQDLDLKSSAIVLVPNESHHGMIPAIPKAFDRPERRTQWWQDWYNSDAGRQVFLPLDRRGAGFVIQSNGSLRSEIMVAPGRYWVKGGLWRNKKKVAKVDQFVEIPEGNNESNGAVDIGKIILKAALQAGNPAPDFSVKTFDGQSLKLSNLRGKYVLLDFWATWCVPCVEETPNLQATYDAFGLDSRFVMIGLSLDADIKAPEKFVRTQKVLWPQAFLGDWAQDQVTRDFEVGSIPSIWLIGPDGSIISRNLRGPKIKERVASVLRAK